MTAGRKEVSDLVTRDISVSGTCVTTRTSFPERTRFILDFTILNFEVCSQFRILIISWISSGLQIIAFAGWRNHN